MRRHIFVGDIHGCLEELQNLLRLVQFDADEDVLISCGDLTRKGVDSAGVVSFFRSLPRRYAVLGNHDTITLSKRKKQPELLACEEDWEWLSGLPSYLTVPDVGVLVVHAGLVPWQSLEQMSAFDMQNMRYVCERRRATYVEGPPAGALRWAQVYDGRHGLVVFGHDAKGALQEEAHAIGLDTGCVNGRYLTCLVLPARQLASVPATRATRDRFRLKKAKKKAKSMARLARHQHQQQQQQRMWPSYRSYAFVLVAVLATMLAFHLQQIQEASAIL